MTANQWGKLVQWLFPVRSLAGKLLPASKVQEKRASGKPNESKSFSGFQDFRFFFSKSKQTVVTKMARPYMASVLLLSLLVPAKSSVTTTAATSVSNLQLLCERVGVGWGLGGLGGAAFPPSSLFYFFHPPLSRPAPLSPRHSVGRQSKVTMRRPFLALYQSLKGNNEGMCDEKNGRISRKAEDKVPQNAGLVELCKEGWVGLLDEFRRCVCVKTWASADGGRWTKRKWACSLFSCCPQHPREAEEASGSLKLLCPAIKDTSDKCLMPPTLASAPQPFIFPCSGH